MITLVCSANSLLFDARFILLFMSLYRAGLSNSIQPYLNTPNPANHVI